MLPSFGLESGFPLTVARGASVAALLSVFGALAFRIFVASRCFERMPAETTLRVKRRLLLTTQGGVAAYLVATLAWLALQATDMADATSAMQAFAVLPTFLSGTSSGRLIVLQLVAILAVAIAVGRRDARPRQLAALGLAGVTVALQAGHGHAGSLLLHAPIKRVSANWSYFAFENNSLSEWCQLWPVRP